MDERKLNISVVGIGGCGGNILSGIYNDYKDSPVASNLTWAAINTDTQALRDLVDNRGFPESGICQIGDRATGGLGAGSMPKVGEAAATEDLNVIREIVNDRDMIIVAAGFGGGSGSGITPVLLREAKEAGALTLSWFIMPYEYEGRKRNNIARNAIKCIHDKSDSYVVISNDAPDSIVFQDSMSDVNNIVSKGTQIVLEVLVSPSMINLDFADFTTVVSGGGRSLFSLSSHDGEGRDKKVAKELLKFGLQPGASPGKVQKAIVFISGGSDMRKDELKVVTDSIRNKLSDQALVLLGVNTKKEKQSLDAVFLGSMGT